VHDGWLSYTFYPKCRHALCGAHIARELTYFEESGEETKEWAGTLKELLLEMKGEAERACADGATRLAAERLAYLTVSYEKSSGRRTSGAATARSARACAHASA
jgi:transposase